MSDVAPPPASAVVVRYWAGARAAAGRAEDTVPAGTLDEVLRAALSLHPDNDRLDRIVSICSVLVGENPVGSRDHSTVQVPGGCVVELLPPFAGGATTCWNRHPVAETGNRLPPPVATVDACVRPG
jgi:molybdopterin converting factor small subunit